MKIAHKAKKAAHVHPHVADLIEKLLNTPTDDLPDLFVSIKAWNWPRSDLNAWIKVLNRFDGILEDVIRDYDVDKLQVNVFTPRTKGIVCGILRFERLLLENSTNRKSFNSYDRVNSLLFTSDLDVLILALNLLLRPAQQYSAQQSVAQALNISTSRLQSLARRWASFREYGVGLTDLVNEAGATQVNSLPAELREVQFTFYRKDAPVETKPKDGLSVSDPTPKTPARKPSGPAPTAATSSPGAVHVHLSEATLGSKPAMEVLADVVEEFSIPDEEKFELLCRIRSAQALFKDHKEDRAKLVTIRLLALAIFCHTHQESQTNSALFLYEPELVGHVAELLQLDRGVPIAVQTSAIAALDAIARYRNKISEVLTAVNAGVNHGILLSLLRQTISDVASPDSTLPQSFLEALLSFVTFLASHGAGGNMVVAAGLVPLLVQTIENRLPNRLYVVSKTMQLVDNVLYGFANAFQLFCAGQGVDVLVGRIEYEVDLDIQEGGDQERSRDIALTYGHLSVARAAVLKNSLRSMHRMMQSSGTSEGLRGLIDSSLLKSVKKIMEHRVLFGPSVLSIAINIMATFVHNEPTSLTVIQEARVPEAFYQAIDAGLEPVIEVIQAVPNALGALCLNQVGQDQLATRPTIIPGLFSIFTSERHLQVLQDKENSVLIGTSIDELIRHHPTLKNAVLEALKSTLSKIENMGNAYEIPVDLKSWYRLVPPSVKSENAVAANDEDVAMGDVTSNITPVRPSNEESAGSSMASKDKSAPPHDNHVVTFIDILGRFLEGLFTHHLHCEEFIHTIGGLDQLGRLTALPCLPYDFANSVSSDSMVQIIRTLAEAAPNATLTFLSNLVKTSLDETKDFWEKLGGSSRLAPLVETADEDHEHQQYFRRLITLQTRVTLLSEVYATAGHAHGRTALAILQALMGRDAPEIIPDLGALHRACVWENIVLKKHLGTQDTDLPSTTDGNGSDEGGTAAPGTSIAAQDGLAPVTGNSASPTSPKPESTSKSDDGPRNAKALKHIVTQIPAALAPLFQAIVKLFNVNPKRLPDSMHKKHILDSVPVLANVMLKHLTFGDPDDTLSSFSYLTVALGLVTVLLVDERSSQTLHTALLEAFVRGSGIQALLAIPQQFISSIEQVTSHPAENRSDAMQQELIHAYGGLKVFLHLLQPIISSKFVFEAPQTSLLLTPEKKDGDPGYFEPHKFLVQMRVHAIPLVRNLWEASWLQAAPQGVIKSVIQIALEFVKAENEELNADLAQTLTSLGAPPPAPTPTILQPDENRIQQLTDMGFPRRAAERALLRTRNNVAAAADLIISQPYLFPAEPDPLDAPMDEDTTGEGSSTPSGDGASNVPQRSESPSDTPSAEPAPPPPVEKKAEEWLKELNELREPLKTDIGPRALRLVDEHPSLVFDVQPIFTGPRGSYQEHCVRRLIEDIKAFSPHAYSKHELTMAVRCRLLALALNTSASQDVLGSDAKNVMELLLALLLSMPGGLDKDSKSVPKWLAAHLLVVEALLMMGEQPRSITLPKEGETVNSEELYAGPSYSESRSLLFDFCMRLLSIPELSQADLLSTLRMVVLLTRDHVMARDFVQREGIQALLRHLKTTPDESSVAVKSHIMVIIRHVVEDEETLRQTIRVEIKRYLTNPKHRFTDVTSYMRGCNAPALRNPGAFIKLTEEMCHLSRPFGGPQQVLLKDAVLKEGSGTSEPTGNMDAGDVKMPIDVTLPTLPSTQTTEALDVVIHLLIGELSKCSKPSNDSLGALSSESKAAHLWDTHVHTAPSEATAPGDADKNQEKETDKENDKAHRYSCFIMQTLTELLFSYDSCKLAFLGYTHKKRLQTPAKESANKFRSAALNLLLNDLVAFGTLDPRKDKQSQARHVQSNWAMSVIVALCVDTNFPQDIKEVTQDVISVRRYVLDAVNRSIKDLPSGESMEARYGRLYALAELCHRLLTVRPSATSKKQDETPTHIAKVMLEKSFVGTLTSALGEVDLNYPNVKQLVSSILRPLEYLSKLAIKVSRAEKGKEVISQPTDDWDEVLTDLSSEDDEDDDRSAEGAREETPDLYRNSSLGMFTGEMEDVQFQPGDDMDEDAEEDDDVEMDYDEETGSEDTSATEDAVDLAMEGGDQSVGTWQDEEDDNDEHSDAEHEDDEDEDGDDDDGDGDGGDDDEDSDDDEDEEAAEPLWQDDGEDDMGVNPLGGAISVEIPVAQGDLNEAEVLSEEEEITGALEALDAAANEEQGDDEFEMIAHDPLSFAGHEHALPRGARRTLLSTGDLDFGIFGLAPSRHLPPTETDPVVHPLLAETGPPPAPSTAGLSRTRRTQRNDNTAAFTANAVLQTIQDVLGPTALQVFQRIAHRTLDHGDVARLGADLGGAPIRFQTRISRNGEPRSESRGFDPMLTLQRWQEEVKILQGKVAGDHLSKLQNHVVLALLPEAIKAAEEAKAREETRKKEEEAERAAEETKAAEAKAAEEAKLIEAAKLAEEAKAAESITQTTSTDAQPQGDDDKPMASPTDGVTASTGVDETSTGPTSSSSTAPAEEVGPLPSPPRDVDTEMPEANDELVAEAGGDATAGPSGAPERVTVMIHGNAVDITDTGIDPTFLEALPDEMREEVLNQHIRDQRAARVERPADSEISSEFLDALPPELRAEIIQQETVDRARRRADEARATAPPTQPPAPAEIDPASFLASLDPSLRQVVLMDQDDGFIQSLPAHMIAEATGYRSARRAPQIVRAPAPRSAPTRKSAAPRESMQLLDKAGIAVLVRLLFFPQALKKKLLFMLLVNLCENSKTRTDLFNLLFDILQDGTGDLSAIDKSFAQLSFRTPKAAPTQTPKAAGKQRASSDYLSVLALPSSEAVPELIAQRSLEAMSYIVNSNDASSMFFLTEHELPAGLRKGTSKKGKGKEKQLPQTHFPVVLLLSLLDRHSLLRTPVVTESVVSLLATVTKPLSIIGTKQAEASKSEQPGASTVSGTSTASQAASTGSTGNAAPQADTSAPLQPAEATPANPTDEPERSDAPAPAQAAAPEPIKAAPSSTESPEEKILLANPPQIPHAVLRLIVNVLTLGECSGRAFQQTLALIQHLSYIGDNREVIAQELRSKAQEFGHTLHTDLQELAGALEAAEGNALSAGPMSKFSVASSDQAKLLRVLKTIDYMYSSKNTTNQSEDAERVQAIYESFRFAPLWSRLGDCLTIIEEKQPLEHVATVLLPLIESLMVVCKHVGAGSPGSVRAILSAASPRSPTTPRESMEDLFVTFTDNHRKVLNTMVRNNPSLMSGSFSLLVNNPRVLDFDNKRNYFNLQLHPRTQRDHHSTLQLNVRRQRVFEDSFQYLQRKTGDQIKHGKLSIRFYDEEGVDAGGLTREWFQILARQMFDPNYALFQPCVADKLTYQPNRASWVNPEHLSFFKFVGRVIGKAIFDGRLLDAYFARSFYRQLLDKTVDYRDVEWVDPEYYNSLCWILDNDPSVLDLTFSVEADEFGITKIIHLKENGENIAVTNENKKEYVQLSAQHRLYTSIKDQIDSLLAGFYEVIPKDLIAIFNEQEVELLISGTPDVDVDEWRAATEYHGYSASDPVIVWWWRALKSFNREERAKVLSFATGTSRVPLGGFGELQGVQGVQKFSIHRAYGASDRLPQAHTCFNQIDLPEFSSYEKLRQQLLFAINEGGEGFGFA